MKKIKSVVYYECPVCGLNSSNREKMQRHYAGHTLKTDEVVYCNICGAGWHVNHYGKRRAVELAEECHQKHVDEGNVDKVAGRTFFLSGGSFGYVRVKEGKND
ncbi:hypothetical protein [Lacrimispora indolis]|uniref:hypothetical protein n=1 Tax=Lacrimispora indolis TaxID=69825 RepID=UPI00041831F2|nr:hypothetical protein [[Clostridium] methoxybenzovorans]